MDTSLGNTTSHTISVQSVCLSCVAGLSSVGGLSSLSRLAGLSRVAGLYSPVCVCVFGYVDAYVYWFVCVTKLEAVSVEWNEHTHTHTLSHTQHSAC